MGWCAAAYGGVVVRSLSCEAMRSMKILSIPAVVFLFGFGYVVNFMQFFGSFSVLIFESTFSLYSLSCGIRASLIPGVPAIFEALLVILSALRRFSDVDV